MSYQLPRLPRLPRYADILRRGTPKPILQAPKQPKTEKPTPPDAESGRRQRWRQWARRPEVQGSNSYAEFIVWEYLTNKRRLKLGRDFLMNYAIRNVRLNFYFRRRNLAWNLIGRVDISKGRGSRAIQRAIIGDRLQLVYLAADDLLTNSEFTLDQAWRGIEATRI